MDKKFRALVIIPAYNEEKNVGRVIDKIQKIHPGVDIAVIDDGSSDNTAKVAREKGVRVLSHCVNLGAGAATQTGYRYALRYPYEFIVQLDADVIMLAHFAGFRIKEVPVIMHEDASGRSQLGGHRLIYYGFKTLLSIVVTLLRKKPKRR